MNKKFVSISDVHIKEPGDKAEQLFLNFIESEETKQADYIFLLGDIFDLLVGSGYEVESRYSKVFMKIEECLKQGKKIFQYEGNHDFHFQNLVKHLCKKWSVDSKNWQYLKKPRVFDINGRKILFCHGDEIEIGNYSYKFYRLWIRSFPIHILSNHIVPPKWVQAIGDNASRKSRERNNDRYDENLIDEHVRPRFREAARRAADKYKADVVICGHSHCLDEYSRESIQYFNNGYFPITHSFISGDSEGISIIVLPAAE